MKPELDPSNSTVVLTQIIVNALKAKFLGPAKELEKVTSIERHKKRFDSVQDIKKEVSGTGCIRVTAIKVSNVRRDAGYTVGLVSYVAFVMCNDQYGSNRDLRAEVIASRLGAEILNPSFSKALGDVAHKAIESADWQPLNTTALDDIGIAMWAINWQQECRLNAKVDINKLDDFLTCGLTAETADGAPSIQAEFKLQQEQHE